MMKRNGILLAGKKILSTLALTTLSILPLQADLQMTLMDKDGVQIKQCIKSYSFSNNLESIARQKGVAQDVYSEEETLTNKVFMGKPVYRKIVRLGDLRSLANDSNTFKSVSFNIDNIDTQISAIKFGSANDNYEYSAGPKNQYRDSVYKNFFGFVYSTNDRKNDLANVNFIVEYTKTTDVANTSSNSFKSYIHYIPSSSTTNEVITKDLENKGVIFDKNYTYDSSTDSCMVVGN